MVRGSEKLAQPVQRGIREIHTMVRAGQVGLPLRAVSAFVGIDTRATVGTYFGGLELD